MRTYAEKLRDPRWQKKRLEILQRDNWQCSVCFSKTGNLQVDHQGYQYGMDPWEYSEDKLWTLCEGCHGQFTEKRRTAKALVDASKDIESLTQVILALQSAAELHDENDAPMSQEDIEASRRFDELQAQLPPDWRLRFTSYSDAFCSICRLCCREINGEYFALLLDSQGCEKYCHCLKCMGLSAAEGGK